MSTKEVSKEKDLTSIVHYLSGVFNNIVVKMPRAFRGKTSGPNEAYKLETEFAYLLNELMQGPKSMQQKYITDINNFIDGLVTRANAQQKNAE